jgi:hypothetical protein
LRDAQRIVPQEIGDRQHAVRSIDTALSGVERALERAGWVQAEFGLTTMDHPLM